MKKKTLFIVLAVLIVCAIFTASLFFTSSDNVFVSKQETDCIELGDKILCKVGVVNITAGDVTELG